MPHEDTNYLSAPFLDEMEQNDEPVWLKRDCPMCVEANWSSSSDRSSNLHIPGDLHSTGDLVPNLHITGDLVPNLHIGDDTRTFPNSRIPPADWKYARPASTEEPYRPPTIRRLLEEAKSRLNRFEDKFENFEKLIREKFNIPVERNVADGRWRELLAEKTTIHGLKEVLTETQRLRLYLWIIIIFTAMACSGWYIKGVFEEYMINPTATKVKIMKQNEYAYPVILLCPDLWLDAPKALAMNLSESGLQYVLGFLINYSVARAPYMIPDYYKAKDDFDEWWYNGPGTQFDTIADFFKYVALDSDDFITGCSYCDLVEGPSPFAKIIMNEAVCYNLSLTSADGRVALTVLEQLRVQMPKRSKYLLAERSYWRFIVNPDLSLGMSETHYLQVFPNHSNTVRVMTHHFKSLPNSRCVTLEYVKQTNYSQSACVADCFTAMSTECSPYPLIRSKAIPKNVTKLCNTAKLMAMNFVEESGEPTIVDTPPDCLEKCPSLCEKWVYESSVESHTLTGNDEGITSLEFLNQAVQYGGILSHEEVETYSFETLVSNIGGQMGLWLGASLMSWVELAMFIITTVWERIRKTPKSMK